ncbi:MAG: hypothetical protein ABEJ72_01860, partial [Candidatus Aenigmatarchaeota archaeon]
PPVRKTVKPLLGEVGNMTSTEHVNLERYIQQFKQDPDLSEENKEDVLQFLNNIAAEDISDSQQRKYLFSFKTLLKKFSPDDFQLADADGQELRNVMAEVHRSDYSKSVRRMIGIALKRYYKLQNGGEVGKPVLLAGSWVIANAVL